MSNLSLPFLEAVNGVLFVTFLGVEYFFARYIINGFERYGWRLGRRRRAGAIAVAVLIFGDLVIRGAIWIFRHAENKGGQVADYVGHVNIATTLGVAICICGGICVLREFAPREWGAWPWLIVTGAALLVGIGFAL